jgi:hypothetical protein
MPVSPITSQGNGVPFLVSAGIVFEIIAANCSSPQTCELNADKRAPTLMKWVNIGMLESALFVAVAVMIDEKHAYPIIAGGAIAAALMYGGYWHGRAAGLKSSAPGTEQW